MEEAETRNQSHGAETANPSRAQHRDNHSEGGDEPTRAEPGEGVGEMMSEAERAIEEHEGAICPEDCGCKEYIIYLQKKLAQKVPFLLAF